MDNKKNSCVRCLYQNPSAITATTILHQFSESLGAAIDAKDPFTSLHSEEVAEIVRSSGTQFDPDVVTAFMGISEKIRSLLNFLSPEQDKIA